MSRVYLDHSATTPIREQVLQAMLPYFSEISGNASSLHMFGQRAKRALEESRRAVAGILDADPQEIIFTSGGTESDNLALKGAARAGRARGQHLITAAFEHHAILHTCRALEDEGFDVTYLPIDGQGIVDLDALKESIREDTLLVSVMLANNEVGTIQPLAEIASIARSRGVLVHTDAVQAVGKMPVNVAELGVDLLSLTAHKFYGPKGAGVLYVRQGTPINPLLHGGHQGRGMRPGTDNVAGVVGLAAALRLVCQEMDVEVKRLAGLRDRLEAGIHERLGKVYLNGHPVLRLPHILNVSFAGVDGEALLLALDMRGIAVSTGSACTAGATDPSHVLLSMGVDPALAQGSLRFSLGHANDDADIDYVLDVLVESVCRLREIAHAHTPRG